MTTAQKLALSSLDVKFESGDLRRTVTARQFLQALLIVLFEEGEGFSGKRPFGNSAWEWDLARAWVQSGHLKGKIMDDDLDFKDKDFRVVVKAAINAL